MALRGLRIHTSKKLPRPAARSSTNGRIDSQAERINNTMKNELFKGKRFTGIGEVIASVASAVDFYNNETLDQPPRGGNQEEGFGNP